MRLGAFEVHEPVPEIRDAHVIAVLRPWLNAGRVGTQTLNRLNRNLEAKELARLARPGNYYDFTEYRPRTRIVDDRRVLTIPNSILYYARDHTTDTDYIFLDMREPHAKGDTYTDEVVSLLKHFGVAEYCRIGAMYNSMPHTRPLLVTGSLSQTQQSMAGDLVSTQRRTYRGPTSITNLITDELAEAGVTTSNLMVHLPQYLPLDRDYMGAARIIEVLCKMYGFPSDLADFDRAERQYEELSDSEEANTPEMKSLVEQLETRYDRRVASAQSQEPDDMPFSADVAKFLDEMGQRLDSSQDDQ